ncbi:tetratricopeptide repeat protein [Buchnera aphidicola]|uniref:transglutaminase family protein n=1 Tax=Buchnera aphidicola TaxID=9 RepID=UPI002237F62D|nr:tetratricopeptide repeat protein [Buchnera aphidicola]MCW5197746.1 tetratricopeptide repeat protein [Buchnera aphidicola (Chaitophorus viminalis)]
MNYFSDINFSKFTILESIFLCFKKIKNNFSTKEVFSNLDNKLKEAENYLSNEENSVNKLNKLLELFYLNWNFRAIEGKYDVSDVLWIDKVLKTYQGTAISLGVILLHFADKLKIPLSPVVFPTQFILRADFVHKKTILINPFNGDILNHHILELWLKGNISSSAKLYKKYLEISKSKDILKKILNTLKSALMEENKILLALKVSNVLLKFYPNDPYEIRDRGLIYSQLECYSLAIKDFSYFINKCPDDPISEIINLKIKSIKKKFHIVH